MRFIGRKLTLQLTPLLDLLLIVIFAQYLELRESAARTEAGVRQQAASEVAALRKKRALDSRQREAAERRWTELKQEHSALAQKLTKREYELTTALRRAIEQQERVGDIVAELFQLPDELVERALKPRNPTQQSRSPEQIEQLRQAFRDLAKKRGRAVLQHLFTFEELRKRCDIWKVYVTETGLIDFRVDEVTHTFRADTAEDFATELFDRYKALPDRKRLVIILFSYGDAKAGPRQAVLDGLPVATARMQADSSGQTRFEYADLGYNPGGPGSQPP